MSAAEVATVSLRLVSSRVPSVDHPSIVTRMSSTQSGFASGVALSDSVRKLVRSLHLRKDRDAESACVAEGALMVRELLRSAWTARFVVMQSDMTERYADVQHLCVTRSIPVYLCSEKVFGTLCDTNSPQGILAVANQHREPVSLDGNLVLLDAVQDPGNVGTIIRSAHFFGYDALILGEGCADLYNPKVMRSTMGSVFALPVRKMSVPEFVTTSRESHTLIGAAAHAPGELRALKPQGARCIVIGSEAHGISAALASELHHQVRIVGIGGAESLNAAVAAGIILHHCSQDFE